MSGKQREPQRSKKVKRGTNSGEDFSNTADERNRAPPKKPWNDDSPKYQQTMVFHGFKVVQDFAHPQYESELQRNQLDSQQRAPARRSGRSETCPTTSWYMFSLFKPPQFDFFPLSREPFQPTAISCAARAMRAFIPPHLPREMRGAVQDLQPPKQLPWHRKWECWALTCRVWTHK